MATWVPDILGPGFECTTFDLGPDVDAKPEIKPDADHTAEHDAEHPGLAATLVRALPRPLTPWQRMTRRARPFEDVDVLYVHGWSDYFFQKNLAAFWTNRGARFFALDLRRYGRSLREGQTPGYVSDLADYDQEIGLAIDEIGKGAPRESQRKLVLLGHSTGGLVLSLWCSRNPGAADALLLNSPWLEFQFATRARQIITPIVRLGARYNPLDTAPLLDQGFYSRAQTEVGPKAELDGLNLAWRPAQVRTMHNGWMSAILTGHEQVHRGLGIETPICVLLSARSVLPTKWTDDLTRADTVLDVDEVAKAALHLGSSVTIERIDGALHDIFLSADTPRREAYDRLERWMLGWSGAAGRVGR